MAVSLAIAVAIIVVGLSMLVAGVAGADDPVDPPTSEPTTTTPTTAAPTTAAPTTAPTTAAPTVPPTAAPTTRGPTQTTRAPATTTTESTTTTEGPSTTTTRESTTTAPAVLAPDTTTTVAERERSNPSGGMSTPTKLGLIVGGLVGVGALISALTVAYWRHTRPVHYLDALDVLDLIVGPDLNKPDEPGTSRDDMSWLRPDASPQPGDVAHEGGSRPAAMPIVTLEDLFGEGPSTEAGASIGEVDVDGLWEGLDRDVEPTDTTGRSDRSGSVER